MPKLRAPLFSLGARGRLGELFSLVRRRGQNIIERRPIPIDAKSTAQLFYRSRFTDCVAQWHLLSEAEKKEWETKARHMTGYAAFMRYCLALPPVVPEEMTFYSDAHPEVTSVDGRLQYTRARQLFSVIVAGPGSAKDDTSNYLNATLYSDDLADTWLRIYRAILLFDTSPLPDAATILSAILTIFGEGKLDNLNISPTLNVFASNPASNTQLQASDYATLGSTPFCDTPIAYADFKTGTPGDPNTFNLNAAGLAAISKTGVTKLGLREASYDAPDTAPAWIADKYSSIVAWSADKGGDYRPKLVVTYTE